MRKPRVYVVNKGGHDYSAASRFGDLVFITEGTIDRFDTDWMLDRIREAMADSDPSDYIIITSLNTICSLACALFAAKHGCLNMLIFKRGDYITRRHKL